MIKKKRVFQENNDYGFSHKLAVALQTEWKENSNPNCNLVDSVCSDTISISHEDGFIHSKKSRISFVDAGLFSISKVEVGKVQPRL